MTPEERHQKIILVVDDDAMTRMVLRSMLKKEGYSVLEAEEGGQALSLYIEYHPALILCDRAMPMGMSGFDFLGKLRELPSDVPFVFLTSLIDARDRMAVASMGVADYLDKPVTLEKLRACLDRIFV